MDIAELKSKSIAELHDMAEELSIANFSGLRKQDLIFRIEQNLLDSDVVLRGEGVLEILPEYLPAIRRTKDLSTAINLKRIEQLQLDPESMQRTIEIARLLCAVGKPGEAIGVLQAVVRGRRAELALPGGPG